MRRAFQRKLFHFQRVLKSQEQMSCSRRFWEFPEQLEEGSKQDD